MHVDSAYFQKEEPFSLSYPMVSGYHHIDGCSRIDLPPHRAGGMSRARMSRRVRRGRPRRVPPVAEVVEVRPGEPLPEPVDRDNCPRCNVRFDIGCRHRRAPLSMGAW